MKEKKMVMGVDPGTQKMGIAITNGKELKYHMLIKTSASTLENRLENIDHELLDIFMDHALDIDHVVIESAFVGKFKGVSEKLGRAQGLIIAKCISYNIPYSFLTPIEIKKGVHSARATKQQVIDSVKELVDIPSEYIDSITSDVADAIAASYTYCQKK